MRPLHSRLRRDPPQRRAGPARQGLHGRHRVRPQPADGQLVLRVVRRVHGVLPHRRADQQERGARRCCRGEPVDVEELQQLPYFQKVSGTFLELNKNAVVRRHFSKGDIVCREGEYGSTAFYIVEGKAEVFLSTPMAHVKTGGGRLGIPQQD